MQLYSSLALLVGGLLVSGAPVSSGSKRIVAYYTAWSTYDRNFQVADIQAEQLTHINYAFANIDASGKITLGDPFADTEKAFPGDSQDAATQPFRGNLWQLTLLKKKNPQLKTLISVGGWTWSGKFSDVALTDQSRQTFAQSCADFIKKYNLDGVDIDWEYPVEGGLPENTYRPEDGANYILLLKAIRAAIGADKLLTIAAPAGPDKMRHIDAKAMAEILDFMNIMTYDFKGSWTKMTGHQANLYTNSEEPEAPPLSADAAVQFYKNAGMPADKMLIGGAIYGRAFSAVGSTNNGLFQSFTGVPKGSWEDGVLDYKALVADLAAGKYQRFWDNVARAPWLYDAASKVMVSYDDVESIKEKAKYIQEQGLGGLMFWELSADTKDAQSLIATTVAQFTGSVPATPATPPQPQSSSINTGEEDAVFESQSLPDGTEMAPGTDIQSPADPLVSSAPEPQVDAGDDAPATDAGLGSSLPVPSDGKTSTGCVQAGDSCQYGKDLVACGGTGVAICGSDNIWAVQPCATGTQCMAKGGQVFCQWSTMIEAGAQTC